MKSINFNEIIGPTREYCYNCKNLLYIEFACYGFQTEPNNFYCSNCRKSIMVDDDTLMIEYFYIKSRGNENIAKRRYDNWLKKLIEKNEKKYY